MDDDVLTQFDDCSCPLAVEMIAAAKKGDICAMNIDLHPYTNKNPICAYIDDMAAKTGCKIPTDMTTDDEQSCCVQINKECGARCWADKVGLAAELSGAPNDPTDYTGTFYDPTDPNHLIFA